MVDKFKTYTVLRPRLRRAGGWFFIILCIFGVVLPILPGWLMIFIGIEILGIHIVFIEKLKQAFAFSTVKKDK